MHLVFMAISFVSFNGLFRIDTTNVYFAFLEYLNWQEGFFVSWIVGFRGSEADFLCEKEDEYPALFPVLSSSCITDAPIPLFLALPLNCNRFTSKF